MKTQVPANPGIDNTLIEVEATKQAIFLPRKGKQTSDWVGYIYANTIKNTDTFEYVKDGTDQWGNSVKVYKTNNKTHLDTPSGVNSSDLVVLI